MSYFIGYDVHQSLLAIRNHLILALRNHVHCVTRPEGYQTFFMLNTVQHEMFSVNKYENAYISLHVHIYQQECFHSQLCVSKMEFATVSNLRLIIRTNSCSAQLSMKKFL